MVLLTVSLVFGVVSVRASPESPHLRTGSLTPLLSNILRNVNTIGDDSFSTVDPITLSPPPTQHYGPFATTKDPDSGTCGNDWATDQFTRFFSIFSQNGAIVVVEQFKDGTFVTPAPAGDPFATPMSPGACDNSTPYDGGIVNPGVTGSFHGYEIIPIPTGIMETSNDPSCVAGAPSAPCSTAGFLDSHFTGCTAPLVSCSVTTFFFHYSGGLGQGLIANSWIDSSSDRAGEIGDIKSTTI